MSREQIAWKAPRPLWDTALPGGRFEQPAILRFAGDDFMEALRARLDADRVDLGPLVAGTETWQEPGAGLGTSHDTAATNPIKLFHPTHGRYYLATGSLVCAKYGLPDRTVTGSDDEAAAFLLRRLVPSGPGPVDIADPGSYVEFAWIADGDGHWQQAATGVVVDGEQRLPVFPLPYAAGSATKRLLAGLIPVSGREAYERSPQLGAADIEGSSDPLAPLADPRLGELEPVVVALQGLVLDLAVEQPDTDLMREALFFALVDLASWLDDLPSGFLDDPAAASLAGLLDEDFDPARSLSWLEAVEEAAASEAGAVFDEDELAPLPVRGVNDTEIVAAVGRVGVTIGDLDADPPDPLGPTGTEFFVAAAEAVAALPPIGADPTTGGDTTGSDPADPRSVYVTRMLYERPRCRPAERFRLSKPSRPFRFAPFHDPDAPARPIRIALPIDTSPEGLRKFPKNVSMVLSSELRKQMQRVDSIKLGDLDDGNIPAGRSVDFGMICTLSIPIITICALILLMIIVSLLNIVFFWLPLFKICLPVPKEA